MGGSRCYPFKSINPLGPVLPCCVGFFTHHSGYFMPSLYSCLLPSSPDSKQKPFPVSLRKQTPLVPTTQHRPAPPVPIFSTSPPVGFWLVPLLLSKAKLAFCALSLLPADIPLFFFLASGFLPFCGPLKHPLVSLSAHTLVQDNFRPVSDSSRSAGMRTV